MILLLIFTAVSFAGMIWLYVESVHEQEPRAPKVALAGAAVCLALGIIILFVPVLRPFIGVAYLVAALAGLTLFIPFKNNPKALAGCQGMVVGKVTQADERDSVFARNRSLRPESEEFRRYYEANPEKKETDDKRRAKGGNVGVVPGSIDSGYPPNVAMMDAGFSMPPLYGPLAHVDPAPQREPVGMDPIKATEAVKGFARSLGADLVGVCKTDKRWQYSHRGEIFYDNWEAWGRRLPEPLPFALVFAVEMEHAQVVVAPHTPTVVESAVSYAKGAYIATMLARWFGGMGYHGVANHSRHYDLLMVPMAVDAGLGELGRQGYLIARKFGPRVRIFVVTTDMDMTVDKPVDLGAQTFCTYCKKCAESCPSHSIPLGEKVVTRGVEKWQLDQESCYEYWAKVGTDCSVCMAVCPYARPDTPLHRLARFVIRNSALASRVLPHLDNFVYGRHWKPRKPESWINHRQQK